MEHTSVFGRGRRGRFLWGGALDVSTGRWENLPTPDASLPGGGTALQPWAHHPRVHRKGFPPLYILARGGETRSPPLCRAESQGPHRCAHLHRAVGPVPYPRVPQPKGKAQVYHPFQDRHSSEGLVFHLCGHRLLAVGLIATLCALAQGGGTGPRPCALEPKAEGQVPHPCAKHYLGVTIFPPSRNPYTRDVTIFYISTLSMLFDICDQSCWQSCVTPIEIRVDVLTLCIHFL